MPKFIVAKEPLALWYQIGEEVEIKDEQAVRNLLREGRINVPEEEETIPAAESGDTLPPA